ncbi:MAG: hypothetical protein QOF14_5721 [Hyphomicrobiales bacterium]|nr:hypothetical protein [Hyphomicrobiales bacterium]
MAAHVMASHGNANDYCKSLATNRLPLAGHHGW